MGKEAIYKIGLGITIAIMAIVIIVQILSGTWSTVATSLNNLSDTQTYATENQSFFNETSNATEYFMNYTVPNGYYYPFHSVLSGSSTGVIPILLVAIAVIGLLIGLFAMMKKGR